MKEVGGSYEHHAGEIKRDIKVVIFEGMVLLRVEHFKKR
jgi:hypothetical protein